MAARNASLSTAADHMGRSSLGGPGRTTIVGAVPDGGGTISPGAVPTGSSTVAPSGTIACLRFAASIAAGSRSGQRESSGSTIRRTRSASALSSEDGRPWKSPTTGAVRVVGGRAEAAGGEDQVHPLVTEEPERADQVVDPVADDRDVRDVDAELPEPLGQPRSVAVDDPPGQHLGAGDDDAGACAHPPQVGSVSPFSRVRPVGVNA